MSPVLLLADELISLEPANANGSLWLLAIGAAIVLVAALYRGEAKSIPAWKRLALAGLRTAALLILCWMWFGWRTVRTPAERQEMLVLVDGTQSMSAGDEVVSAGSPNFSRLAAVQRAFSKPTWQPDQIGGYRWGWSVCPHDQPLQRGDFSELTAAIKQITLQGEASPLGESLLHAVDQQRGRSTAGVIFFTDGNVTTGRTLAAAAAEMRRRSIPLFVVGTGQAKPLLDWRIVDVNIPTHAHLGETLRFPVRVAAVGADHPAKLQLLAADEKVLHEVSLDPTRMPQMAALTYRQETPGDWPFRIRVVTDQNEANIENNIVQRTIAVRPFAAKVLLAWGYPSYEYRFLKSVLERDLTSSPATPMETKAELKVYLQDADPEFATTDRNAVRHFPATREELEHFDAIILGDVNLRALGAKTEANLQDFVARHGGGLAIVAGERLGVSQFADSPLVELLPFEIPDNEPTSEATNTPLHIRPTPLGFTAPLLQLADSADDNAAAWEQLPDIFWQFRVGRLKPAVRILAEAGDKSGGSYTPLITTQFVGKGEVLFHGTDELHRWRFRRGDRYFGRYWEQAVRRLVRTTRDTDRVEFITDKPKYAVGETVELRLRFSDDSQVPTADNGVEVEVQTPGIAPWRLALVRDSLERGLFAGQLTGLAPGDYQAEVVVPDLKAKIEQPLRFEVATPPSESTTAPLNEVDCQAAAEATGGIYRPLDQLEELLAALPAPRLVPAAAKSYTSVWNSAGLAIVFLLLLSGEWWWRQRLGMV